MVPQATARHHRQTRIVGSDSQQRNDYVHKDSSQALIREKVNGRDEEEMIRLLVERDRRAPSDTTRRRLDYVRKGIHARRGHWRSIPFKYGQKRFHMYKETHCGLVSAILADVLGFKKWCYVMSKIANEMSKTQ